MQQDCRGPFGLCSIVSNSQKTLYNCWPFGTCAEYAFETVSTGNNYPGALKCATEPKDSTGYEAMTPICCFKSNVPPERTGALGCFPFGYCRCSGYGNTAKSDGCLLPIGVAWKETETWCGACFLGSHVYITQDSCMFNSCLVCHSQEKNEHRWATRSKGQYCCLLCFREVDDAQGEYCELIMPLLCFYWRGGWLDKPNRQPAESVCCVGFGCIARKDAATLVSTPVGCWTTDSKCIVTPFYCRNSERGCLPCCCLCTSYPSGANVTEFSGVCGICNCVVNHPGNRVDETFMLLDGRLGGPQAQIIL